MALGLGRGARVQPTLSLATVGPRLSHFTSLNPSFLQNADNRPHRVSVGLQEIMCMRILSKKSLGNSSNISPPT